MKIKVCLADDHAIVIRGVASLLKDHPLIELCHTATSGAELLVNMKQQAPDILLLDIHLPDIQGDDLAKTITEHYPQTGIIALTNMDQTFYVRNMFMNGVKGYLLKSAGQDALIEAIEAVSRGKQYIDKHLREQMAYEMVDLHHAQSRPMLTKREKQILDLIANEKTNGEIAKILNVSISTVENHRLNLFFKLGVKNVAGLVRKAIQLALIN